MAFRRVVIVFSRRSSTSTLDFEKAGNWWAFWWGFSSVGAKKSPLVSFFFILQNHKTIVSRDDNVAYVFIERPFWKSPWLEPRPFGLVQYMRYFIYNFSFIPHGFIRIHRWPAPNVSAFRAKLVRTSHRYREITGSNPFEVLFFY